MGGLSTYSWRRHPLTEQVPVLAGLRPARTGTSFLDSTFLGGAGEDGGYGIAVDSAGSAYVTGYTESSDFPTTAGALDIDFNGDWDAFVAKLDPTGSDLTYATFLGGSAEDDGYGIAVDSEGQAYLTGLTYSTRGRKRSELS